MSPLTGRERRPNTSKNELLQLRGHLPPETAPVNAALWVEKGDGQSPGTQAPNLRAEPAEPTEGLHPRILTVNHSLLAFLSSKKDSPGS